MEYEMTLECLKDNMKQVIDVQKQIKQRNQLQFEQTQLANVKFYFYFLNTHTHTHTHKM